jgi:hypothetical protein
MGRANNSSRSLQIISRAQGWDPNKIEGFDTTLESVGYRHRESPTDPSTTQDPFPGNNQTSGNSLTVKSPGADTRGSARDSGPKGDPYPGKPGSRPTRGGR